MVNPSALWLRHCCSWEHVIHPDLAGHWQTYTHWQAKGYGSDLLPLDDSTPWARSIRSSSHFSPSETLGCEACRFVLGRTYGNRVIYYLPPFADRLWRPPNSMVMQPPPGNWHNSITCPSGSRRKICTAPSGRRHGGSNAIDSYAGEWRQQRCPRPTAPSAVHAAPCTHPDQWLDERAGAIPDCSRYGTMLPENRMQVAAWVPAPAPRDKTVPMLLGRRSEGPRDSVA